MRAALIPSLGRKAIVRPLASARRLFRRRAGRRPARSAVGWLGALTVLTFVVLGVAVENGYPELRDPEYGLRLKRLRERVGQHPGRSLVVVLGTSRVSLGVRPAEVVNRPGPMLFNFGLIGSGPQHQLLMMRRLLADGVRPDSVVLEVWPSFLSNVLQPIDARRLRAGEWDYAARYHPGASEDDWRRDRWVLPYAHRAFLLSLAAPGWLPGVARCDAGWEGLDGWGWRPGLSEPPGGWDRRVPCYAEAFHGPILRNFVPHPDAEPGLREFLEVCRGAGVPVTLTRLPESSIFRSWYAPATEAAFAGLVGSMQRDYGSGWIDARDWMDDRWLPDEFHLSQQGAALFTRAFADRVLPALPLGGPSGGG
jgi:hypothetical protein